MSKSPESTIQTENGEEESLRNLLHTIFIHGAEYIRTTSAIGAVATPYTYEMALKSVQDRVERQNKAIEDEYNRATAAAEGPLTRGGFTREEYDEVDVGILNRMARKCFEISGKQERSYDADHEDALNQRTDQVWHPIKSAVPDLDDLYPTDDQYSRESHQWIFSYNNYNIFKLLGRALGASYPDEGIVWDRRYDPDTDMLSFMRVFLQWHRNTLSVKTLPVEKYYDYLKTFIEEGPALARIIEPPSRIGLSAYQHAIDEFIARSSCQIRFGSLERHYSGKNTLTPTDIPTESLDTQPYLLIPGTPVDTLKSFVAQLPSEMRTFVSDGDINMVEWGMGTTETNTRTVFVPVNENDQLTAIGHVGPGNIDMVASYLKTLSRNEA